MEQSWELVATSGTIFVVEKPPTYRSCSATGCWMRVFCLKRGKCITSTMKSSVAKCRQGRFYWSYKWHKNYVRRKRNSIKKGIQAWRHSGRYDLIVFAAHPQSPEAIGRQLAPIVKIESCNRFPAPSCAIIDRRKGRLGPVKGLNNYLNVADSIWNTVPC